MLISDATSPFVGSRLVDIYNALPPDAVQARRDAAVTVSAGPLASVSHYTVPTLPHLLALVVYWGEHQLPQDTILIVIDDLSSLLENAYPRSTQTTSSRTGSYPRFGAGSRGKAAGELGGRLAKLAAQHDVAVIVTSNVVTKIKGETEAILRPAMASEDWAEALDTRLVLFRDWVQTLGNGSMQMARIATVLRASGISPRPTQQGTNAVAFRITNVRS